MRSVVKAAGSGGFDRLSSPFGGEPIPPEWLLEGDVTSRFLAGVLAQPRVKALLSSEHLPVDGTLLEAWARSKSFCPKDGRGREVKLCVVGQALMENRHGLIGGLPIAETMTVVGQELPAPVGTEFRRICDHIRLGSQPDVVLLEAAFSDAAFTVGSADATAAPSSVRRARRRS